MTVKDFIIPKLNIPPPPPPPPPGKKHFLSFLGDIFKPIEMPSQEEIRQRVRAELSPQEFALIERKQKSWEQGIPAQIEAGIGDVYQAGAGAAKWAGFDWLAQNLEKEAKRRQGKIPPIDLGDITWKSALDPQFWAKIPKFTARMTPFTLSLIPAMLLGYAGGVAIAGAVGLGAFGSIILGALGATALSRPLEGVLEAGVTYSEAKRRGMDDARADKAATNVFLNNLKLSGMDAMEIATAFLPGPAKFGRGILKPVTAGGRVIGTMGQEALEEAIQEKFQTEALGDKFKWTSPGTKQAAFGGAIFGGLMGGAGAVFNAVKQRTVDTMPQAMSQRYDKLKTSAIKRGMNEERAGLFALDEITKTPEGKKIVEQATKWVEGQAEQGQVIPESAQAVKAPKMELEEVTPAPEVTVKLTQMVDPKTDTLAVKGLYQDLRNTSLEPQARANLYKRFTREEADSFLAGLRPIEAIPKAEVIPEAGLQPETLPVAEAGILESLATKEVPTPPAQPPIEPRVAIAPEPELPEIPTRPSMVDIQDAQIILDINLKPDRKRYLAQLPGIKQALSHFNPSAVAKTPAEKFRVIRAVGRDQGNQRTQITMSYLFKMGDSSKVFGKQNKQGMITQGTFKGKSVNEIAENIGKYKDQLTNEQREWLDRANDIQNEILEYAEKKGINIEEIGLMPGQRFASRRVLGKLDENGELIEVAYLSPGPGRIGGKIAAQKHRSYASIEEAQKDGFRYMPYDQALEMTVRSIYNAASDKQAADWLLIQVPWRTTGAPEELILKAEGAKIRTQGSSKLLSALNRAVRGERIPGSTIESIRRVYPKEATELEKLIPRLQANEETATDVQALTQKAKLLHEIDLKELKEAINARARAREKAMRPRFGEAMLMQPAFQGKMFTGTEAQETVKVLRDMMEPKHIAGLRGINSVNGLVRYFKLAGDASVMGIQLLIGMFDNPKAFGLASKAYVEALFSEEFHANLLNNNRDLLARHPDLITTLSGTEFTEAFQKSGLLRKGILKIGGKILGPFQRGFEAAIDAYGIEAARAMEHIARTSEDTQEIDQFINEMRGLTSSARLGVSPNWQAMETFFALAPRYNRAIASYIADAFEGFAKTGRAGIRARKARNSLLKFTAGMTTLWIALGFALGKDWDEIKNSISEGLYTYNIAGTNIGPGTKIRSVVKLIKDTAADPEALIQSTMDNPGLRFIRGNLSPVLGTAVDVLTGRNYIGEPVRNNWSNFNREVVISQFLPIWVENVLYEGGSPSQRFIRGSGEFFGGRTYPETEWQTANIWKDRYAAQGYGKKYEDLNNAQRAELSRKHPDLARLEEISRKAWAEKGTPVERFYFAEKEHLQTLRNERLEKAAQALESGKISKYDYDKERSFIRPYYSGGSEVLFSMRESNMSAYEQKQMQKYLDSRKPEDIALSEYNQFYGETIEKADLPKDWELINLEVELFLQKYPQKIGDYILAHKDDWIKNLPPTARKWEEMRTAGIEDETWWDNYRESATTRKFKPKEFGEGLREKVPAGFKPKKLDF